MRRELADFIGARSEAGCKQAECRTATYPVTQHTRKPSQTGGVHVVACNGRYRGSRFAPT